MTVSVRAAAGAVLVLALSATGCIRHEVLNATCTWFDEPAARLDPSNPRDRRHLSADADIAEELGIRYGDSFRGGLTVAERGLRADVCTAMFLTDIARRHGVAVEDVARARGWRDVRVDIGLVFVPMLLLFLFGADIAARHVWARFEADERAAAMVAMLLVSLVVSALAVAIGELWSWTVEMMRVADQHLGYRALRLPWTVHRVAVFAAGVVLFWAVAIRRRDHIDRPGTAD